jgi:hypothetical protein
MAHVKMQFGAILMGIAGLAPGSEWCGVLFVAQASTTRCK